MPRRPPASRPARSYIPMLVFLAACFVIVFLVANHFLLPALSAAQGADAAAKKQLAAISSLVLAIILTTLLCVLLLILRPGRFLFPGKSPPRARTHYSDAWAESARRMETPPDEPPPSQE